MSYILDALKKAETERNLGEIPGVHAQPLHLAADTPERTWQDSPWRWLALIGVALLLGLSAWKWWPAGGEQVHPVAAMAPQPVPVPAPPAVQPAQPMPTLAPAPASITANVPAQDVPATKPPRKTERREKYADTAARTRPSTPKAAEDASVTAFRDLPLDLQREIPALTIGGYIYSSTPADRSVLINQRLLREGDQISPGLTLEGIRPDGVVLGYRGRRFSESY